MFSCYRPVEFDRPIPANQRAFTAEDWQTMLLLAHVDKSRAYDAYSSHYLATSGQLYWSDLLQLAVYLDDYHDALDARLPAGPRGTEMISELYVPRHRLTEFMAAAGESLRRDGADPIYGTVRFIEPDTDTFLPWARADYACIVLNLHTEHTPAGIERSAAGVPEPDRRGDHPRRQLLPDLPPLGPPRPARRRATRSSGSSCAHKRRYDPQERFVSDWYRHHVAAARSAAA